ncbi:MAG TPA: hypothetical protein VLF60_00435 [Candidatus Saccharimonadales bacterium]|nr:hypothetical protein [Candidatus Saccharimonadales bacterium]
MNPNEPTNPEEQRNAEAALITQQVEALKERFSPEGPEFAHLEEVVTQSREAIDEVYREKVADGSHLPWLYASAIEGVTEDGHLVTIDGTMPEDEGAPDSMMFLGRVVGLEEGADAEVFSVTEAQMTPQEDRRSPTIFQTAYGEVKYEHNYGNWNDYENQETPHPRIGGPDLRFALSQTFATIDGERIYPLELVAPTLAQSRANRK